MSVFVWVRLLSAKYLKDEHARMQKHEAGEWVQVGKHDARVMLAAGECEIPRKDIRNQVADWGNSGVVIVDPADPESATGFVDGTWDGMGVQVGTLFSGRPYGSTLFWDPNVSLRRELMPVGFHRVQHGWQVACPLWRYKALALHLGSDDEKKRTLDVVQDLRVPVYNPGLLYVARCPQTDELFDVWKEEHKEGDDRRLSFLRAVFRTRPILCALPVTWTAGPRYTEE